MRPIPKPKIKDATLNCQLTVNLHYGNRINKKKYFISREPNNGPRILFPEF